MQARRNAVIHRKSTAPRAAGICRRIAAFAVLSAAIAPLCAIAQDAGSDEPAPFKDAPPSAFAPAEHPQGPLQPCPAGSLPTPPATFALILDRVKKRVGGEITSVCRMPLGLFEVVVDAEILYVDERANYLFAGNIFDIRTQENLTARRKELATRIDFRRLPLDLAVKTVRGSGTRTLAIFEDPNCPYCKRFEHDIATLNNTTIYTFLYPVLSRDQAAPDDSYPKSKAVWCASDRTQAWSQLMIEGRRLAAAPDSCKHPLEEILTLGQGLHVTGTPTIFFIDGRRAPGAIPMDKVEQMMADALAALPGSPSAAPSAAAGK
jgi:thiol:disulfide interchange protein DsbC